MKKLRNAKKSYLTAALLNILSAAGEASLQFIDEGLLSPNYAFTGFSRELLGLNYRENFKKHRKREVRLRKNLISVTLRRLQKEGLITRGKSNKGAVWKINKFGKRCLGDFVAFSSRFNLPPVDGKIRIVSFDIPEKIRQKRDKLRALLTACDYSLLQRSLWSGRRPLPKSVFKEIRDMKLRHFVHIFEISKRGTIKGLV